MKFYKSRSVFFYVALSAGSFVAHGQSQEQSPGGPGLELFTDQLTSRLYTHPNDCTSVWGISMLFDLLRPGTDSETTLTQICDIAGLCGANDELLWDEAVTNLVTEMNGRCISRDEEHCEKGWVGYAPLLQIANSVWIDDATLLQPAYEIAVGKFVKQIDFQSPQAYSMVNGWVNQTTMGLIDSIIDEEGPIPYDLVAVNTIYLNAGWMTIFNEEYTSSDLFYSDESTTTNAHFMHATMRNGYSGFTYSDTVLNGYQVLQLEFETRGSTLSMSFVLPLKEDSYSWNQEQDTANLLALPTSDVRTAIEDIRWASNSNPEEIAIAIPKFKFESKYEGSLRNALLSMGLTGPFDYTFCGMLEDSLCLSIDKIIQKTTIDVNEKGVIAAAATGVVMVAGGDPPPPNAYPLFLANRPFKFFIYDSNSDIFLFEGFVGAPGIPEGSAAPLQKSHSDKDFWTDIFYLDHRPHEPTKGSAPRSTGPPLLSAFLAALLTQQFLF